MVTGKPPTAIYILLHSKTEVLSFAVDRPTPSQEYLKSVSGKGYGICPRKSLPEELERMSVSCSQTLQQANKEAGKDAAKMINNMSI